MGVTIESNSVRGELLEEIIEKVVRDTYGTLSGVYGPFGKSVFHNSDGIMHTKDGKNVFQSYFNNNEVGNIFRALMLEAISRQERIAGDGTTTVSLLYCILTKILREYFKNNPVSEPHFRKAFDHVVNTLLARMEKYKLEVTEESPDMLALIYTATQNEEYTSKIYDIIKEAKGDTYVALSFNSFTEDITIKRHDKAVLEGKHLYVIGETVAYPTTTDAIILMVKGTFDIRCWETLHHLRYFAHLQGNKDVIVCCAGTTKSTNDCISDYNEYILRTVNELRASGRTDINTGLLPNRIYVYGVKKVREFKEEEMEDFTKLFFHSDDTGSLMDPTIFEQNLLLSMDRILVNILSGEPNELFDVYAKIQHEVHMLYNSRYQLHVPLEVTSNFEYALLKTDFVCEIMSDRMQLNYTKNQLILDKIEELNRVEYSNASYREKIEAKKRLERLSGKFIEVEVGSGLSKDAVRQADAWRDAITSAQNALNGGIIKGSATLLALVELSNSEEFTHKQPLVNTYVGVIRKMLIKALCVIVHELIGKTIKVDHSSLDITKEDIDAVMMVIQNKPDWTHIPELGMNESIPRININHLAEIKPEKDHGVADILTSLMKYSADGNKDMVAIKIGDDEISIDTAPVETFDVFKYILLNSTTAMDIAMTPVILTSRMFGNRI